jgi:hypothetical protein
MILFFEGGLVTKVAASDGSNSTALQFTTPGTTHITVTRDIFVDLLLVGGAVRAETTVVAVEAQGLCC